MIPVSVRVAGVSLLFVALSTGWMRAQIVPVLPVIPANSFNITNFGAVGDGITTNTTAIQNTISAASTAGGGTVEIPAGTFLSGPLTLASSINLQLDSGATLQMLPFGSYPGGTSPSDFITASTLHDLELSGTGTIDGQGNGWWTNNLSTSERPVMFTFSKCNRVLIQNVLLQNSPSMHLTFKNATGNVTIRGMTINTSGFSPNTDGIDLIGTNCLVQNCNISDGDDNIALGSTGGTCSGIMITNCIFGVGHGLSIGGNTSSGVSNLIVGACSFTGTQYGIRMKSDNASSSPGAGGIVQNLYYSNLAMTNLTEGAIVIYSYYNEIGTPTSISPSTAAAEPIPTPVPATTVVWRNIIISNITAKVIGSGIAGIIWGRTEVPATNIILSGVSITAPKTFDVYNARGIQFVNSQITETGTGKKLTLFNASVIISNNVPGTNITVDGLTSTNSLSLYNASASSTAADFFGANPITISGGTLAVTNNYGPPMSGIFNFGLGTNASTVAVTGNLSLTNATFNITNAPGFGAGTYPLFTYTGTENGTFALGSTPANFNYRLTNTTAQIQLVVSTTGPSLTPVSLVLSNSVGNLQLSWPQDHTGWSLQIQTNSMSKGLSTNWNVVPGSSQTNVVTVPIVQMNESVFLRLVYP